jgi:hypothetical protein
MIHSILRSMNRPSTLIYSSLIGAALLFASMSLAAETPKAVDSKSEEAKTVEARSIMSPLFSSLTRVMPLSMSYDEFSSPKNQEKIKADLKIMSDSSAALIEHAKKMHSSYAFIAESMARDTRDILSWYEKGSFQESKYLLHQLSENCISCHAKLKDPGHAPPMENFFKDVNIAQLSPAEKARLQVALRQFDEALTTWETLIETWPRPGELIAMDALNEYLKVAIRVKWDAKRPLKTLDKLAARTQLPRFMTKDIHSWRASLVKLGPELDKKSNGVKRGSSIIRAAQKRMEYPLDRSGLVDFIVASALLNRELSSTKLTPNEESEALYMLGITETLIGRSAWLTQTDYFMEAAIRISPKSKFAAMAYDALEHHILLEYSGSGGIHVPDDIQRNLETLRKMVQK